MARLVRALAAVVFLVVTTAACRVDIRVGLEAAANGSGQVRVEITADRDVVAAADLLAGLRVDDLKQAGWEIEGPTPQPDGGVRVVATKPFRDPDGARVVMEELAGADGPFQGFRLERKQSFARTTTRFSGSVDLNKGIEVFGDAGLREALGGSDVGIDITALEKERGPIAGLLGLIVLVRLPGDVETNAPENTSAGARWEVPLGQRVALTAESSAQNTSTLLGLALAGGAGLTLCFVVLRWFGRRRN